jgi:hypothetical protein
MCCKISDGALQPGIPWRIRLVIVTVCLNLSSGALCPPALIGKEATAVAVASNFSFIRLIVVLTKAGCTQPAAHSVASPAPESKCLLIIFLTTRHSTTICQSLFAGERSLSGYVRLQACQVDREAERSCFLKLKALLRMAAARSIGELWSVIATVSAASSQPNAETISNAAGYLE